MDGIDIRALAAADQAEWRRLWTDYLTFYKHTAPEAVYTSTWKRLHIDGEFEPRGFLAVVEGRPVGLVHYLFHRSCWSLEGNCYLQDLYVEEAARGKNIGEALIAAVKVEAAKRGVTNVYWMTQETNARARKLYDRVARRTGFIEYDLL